MAAPVAGVRRRAPAVSGGACLYGSASSLLTARDDINAALPTALAPHAVFAECVMPSPAGGRVCVLVGVVYRQVLSVTVEHISAAITLALSASPTIPLSSPTPPPATMPLLLLGDWNARSAALGGVAEDSGAGRALAACFDRFDLTVLNVSLAGDGEAEPTHGASVLDLAVTNAAYLFHSLVVGEEAACAPLLSDHAPVRITAAAPVPVFAPPLAVAHARWVCERDNEEVPWDEYSDAAAGTGAVAAVMR